LRAVPVTPLVFGRRCTKEREEAIFSWTGHGTVCTANKRLLEDYLGSLSPFGAHRRPERSGDAGRIALLATSLYLTPITTSGLSLSVGAP
jgi:hypothetical protein